MGTVARMLFVLVLVVAPVVVAATTAGMPAHIASHFGPGGGANGYMSHREYLVLMLVLTTVVPLLVVATTGFIPRFALSQIKFGSRDYWLAPPRRAQTLDWLATNACWMGIVLTVFLTGVHLLVVQANAVVPPRLPEPPFFVLLAAFLALVALWIVRLALRFRKPG